MSQIKTPDAISGQYVTINTGTPTDHLRGNIAGTLTYLAELAGTYALLNSQLSSEEPNRAPIIAVSLVLVALGGLLPAFIANDMASGSREQGF